MSDGRAKNGGKRTGSGRKSKAEELGLQQLLDECWTTDDRRACLKALAKEARLGDKEATKLLMAYAYGKPKERHEITGADGQPLFKAYQGIDPDKV